MGSGGGEDHGKKNGVISTITEHKHERRMSPQGSLSPTICLDSSLNSKERNNNRKTTL
jgi:hypothetical protein